jgi:hypothetical protein
MVIPPRTAATPGRSDTHGGRAKRHIGSKARPRRTTRVALPLPEPPPRAAEWPVDILPPELALVRKLLPPDFQLPPDVLAAMVLPSVPLANATLTLWSYLLHPQFLDDFYAGHRGRCYEDLLTFPAIVALTRDALVLHRGSALPALERAGERGEMPTCQEAYYAKLRRIPPELSEAFLAEATARLAPLLLPSSPRGDALPASVDEFEVICLDGKQIKQVAKRLKAARGRPGKLIGGKVLAAYLPRTGLVVAMAAERDGEANDIRLMPRAVPSARDRTVGPRLWVADRQFGDLDQPALLSEEGDHFLLRRSKRLSFAADPDRPARESADARGLRVVEQWGWIGASKEKRRRYVRQIHLVRPGAEDVYLVTDLLDEVRYPAADLLEVYLKRWGIERVFQKIVEVFHLEHLIGSSPEATIFQASFCLVLYNLLQVMRGYMAAGQAELAADEVSMEKLFEDVAKELTALVVLFPSATVAGWFAGEWTPEEVARRLGVLLGGAWKERYRKAINKKPRPKAKKAKCAGAHTSVQKLVDADRKKRRESKGVP